MRRPLNLLSRGSRRLVVLGTIPVLALAGQGLTTAASASATLCVGGPHCYDNVQAALDAAPAGAVIHINKGSFTGGVTIVRNVRLRGAGVGHTVISGGGPVVTIGSTTTSPTVSISGVTITGGVTTTNPQSPKCGPDVPTCGPGYATATALGGGVEAFPGTIVRIKDSAVVGNRATPSLSVPSVKAVCPGSVPCPASFGDAAGIDNWGTMTLLRTTVSDNHASAAQSNGGGIAVEAGATMTIKDSRVVNNSASAAAPTGRFSSGGGIFVDAGGTLTVRGSRINSNRASVENSFPHPYPMQDGGNDVANALGGGIFITDGASASLRDTTLGWNRISVTSPEGEPFGGDAALCACGNAPLVLDHVRVVGNVVTVNTLSSVEPGPSGGILEADGDVAISHSQIVDNRVRITTTDGDAQTIGTLTFFFGGSQPPSVTHSLISRNIVTATAAVGAATIQGVGITNNGPLLLRDTKVTRNVGRATGETGFAEGGGVWNGVLFGGPESPLSLTRTIVAGNTLTGGPGVVLQGAGVYTPGFPITLRASAITHNTPDQCFGCP